MDRTKAEELLSDMLAGEISAQNLDRLLRYEEENPEFAEFRADLETVWGMGEGLAGDNSIGMSNSISVNIENVSKTISRDRKSNVVDLATLDLLSAAGSGAITKGVDENTDKE